MELEIDDYCVTSMEIRNLEVLKQKSKLKMTDNEFSKWLINGMINRVTNIIDEDINYGVSDSFYNNLKDFLCFINITI